MPGFVLDPARWSCRLRWAIALALFLAVLVAGVLSNPLASEPESLKFLHLPIDKFFHFLVYAAWGWIILSDPKSTLVWIIALCALCLLQESSQMLVRNREFEWLDWVSDSMGIMVAYGVVVFRRSFVKEKP